ncbi:MAG: hypothetical protein ACYC4R_12750 [Anaerolineae bacterium]
MSSYRRLVVSALSIILIVASLIVPATVGAEPMDHAKDSMFVPVDQQEPLSITAGGLTLTVLPGALPKGGLVKMQVWTAQDGSFRLNLIPETDFAAPEKVMLAFASEISAFYYHDGATDIELVLTDIDGDGVAAEVWLEHFSRYSGW